ncbi:MAG: sulfatase [Halobacteriales archaeon]|nr:sulfatase [Halobacteriales archaeon]
MESGTRRNPNILFVVWDACRLDYAEKHAPNLKRLGEEGAWFENAFAPATWSLPSHTSIVTGEYPHEHGVTQPSQSRMPATLVEALKLEGYTCYGVSGNGFASHKWGFDEPFDRFRYTRGSEPYGDGEEMFASLITKEGSKPRLLAHGVSESLSHEKTLKSLANLAAVATNHVSRHVVTPLRRIPHPVFKDEPQYSYSGRKNTDRIRQIIRNESDTEEPFFVFTNYMETHRPYLPDADLQREHLGEVLPRDELVRLNEEVAAPWEFTKLAEMEDESVDEEDVRKVRSLYAGEVEAADRYLGELVDELGARDILEDTLIVVTSDHGENLGETDSLGRRRLGHEASMSEVLARVPLVVSHPDVKPSNVEEPVSLKDLFDLFLGAARDGSVDVDSLTSDVVLCEYPALGDEKMYEKHPDVPDEAVAQRVSQDAVSAHTRDWRVVADSEGVRLAEHAGEETDIDDTPDEIVEFAESSLKELSQLKRRDVTEETAARLEDLGYM